MLIPSIIKTGKSFYQYVGTVVLLSDLFVQNHLTQLALKELDPPDFGDKVSQTSQHEHSEESERGEITNRVIGHPNQGKWKAFICQSLASRILDREGLLRRVVRGEKRGDRMNMSRKWTTYLGTMEGSHQPEFGNRMGAPGGLSFRIPFRIAFSCGFSSSVWYVLTHIQDQR